MCQNKSPIQSAISNWNESTAPLPQKISMFLKNNFIKLRTGKHCCGHPGEVGC